MTYIKSRDIKKFAGFGKMFTAFILGSLIVHILVMFLDYFVLIKPHYPNIHDNFLESLFSPLMVPMMLAYGLLSLTIYLLWEKKKRVLLRAREKEVQNKRAEDVFKSMQRLTGILVEHIASQNTQIMNWIEFRKSKGCCVSQKIEKPNRKIGQALQSLSEISFVTPYGDSCPKNVDDIEKMFKDKLMKMTSRQ